ncbi:hypothetical protein BH10PSE13_BH10PSE13_02830 [soil metagenome]
MKHYRFLVESQPLAGQEADYHAWYDGRHTADLLRLPGVRQTQRFQTVGAEGTRFFMIVDYQTDDLPGLLAEIQARGQSGAMPSSEALDRSSLKITILEAWAPAQSP